MTDDGHARRVNQFKHGEVTEGPLFVSLDDTVLRVEPESNDAIRVAEL